MGSSRLVEHAARARLLGEHGEDARVLGTEGLARPRIDRADRAELVAIQHERRA